MGQRQLRACLEPIVVAAYKGIRVTLHEESKDGCVFVRMAAIDLMHDLGKGFAPQHRVHMGCHGILWALLPHRRCARTSARLGRVCAITITVTCTALHESL